MQAKKRAKAVKFGGKSEESMPESESSQEEQVNVEEKIKELDSEETPMPKDMEQNDTDSETAETENNNTEITITVEDEPKAKEEEVPLSNGPDQEVNIQTPSLRSDTYIVETEVRKSILGYFMLVAVIAFVVGLISMAAFTVYFPKSNVLSGMLSTTSPTTTPTPKLTNTPTPAPKAADLSKYSIKILNGSGVTGVASKLKESLTGEGFKVIDTGNADTSDFTDTKIEMKKDVDASYLTKLKAELEKDYSLAPVSEMSSDSTTEADVIITIGSKTASD